MDPSSFKNLKEENEQAQHLSSFENSKEEKTEREQNEQKRDESKAEWSQNEQSCIGCGQPVKRPFRCPSCKDEKSVFCK